VPQSISADVSRPLHQLAPSVRLSLEFTATKQNISRAGYIPSIAREICFFAFPIPYFRLPDFGGSACPDGPDETGAAVFPGASLAGNFAASCTMAAARSLLILHAGS
jgi:hypothetical protein